MISNGRQIAVLSGSNVAAVLRTLATDICSAAFQIIYVIH